MSLIFLTGMPAAGKTHWGRIWAMQHAWSFIDLDEAIESAFELTIAEIFGAAAESGFRSLEAHILEQVVTGAGSVNTIIATGGGTIAGRDNRELMQERGCVVYLRAKTKTLMQQLKTSKEQRPLLEAATEEDVTVLLEERSLFYEQAHHTVDVERIGEGTFAQILKTCTSRHS